MARCSWCALSLRSPLPSAALLEEGSIVSTRRLQPRARRHAPRGLHAGVSALCSPPCWSVPVATSTSLVAASLLTARPAARSVGSCTRVELVSRSLANSTRRWHGVHACSRCRCSFSCPFELEHAGVDSVKMEQIQDHSYFQMFEGRDEGQQEAPRGYVGECMSRWRVPLSFVIQWRVVSRC